MSRATDEHWMNLALRLAQRGEGFVEPNPMVGCVITRDDEVLGEGFHRKFGGPHAEIVALEQCTVDPKGATAYVTLEPCCHHGKTPPCVDALLGAGISRVVVAVQDPFARVNGQGIQRLLDAKVAVTVGVCENAARQLVAPFIKRTTTGLPWVIAKWAQTLDGRIATRTGDSKWISSDDSRATVHRLRARVDAIITGSGTVRADDPMLNARLPQGATPPRIASRIVMDTRGTLPLESRIVQSAGDFPVVVATGANADADRIEALRRAGCTTMALAGDNPASMLGSLLAQLGEQQMTNVLFEAGGTLMGSLFDGGYCDEVHVFIAPLIAGGSAAVSPVGGTGVARIGDAFQLQDVQWQPSGTDIHLTGRVVRSGS